MATYTGSKTGGVIKWSSEDWIAGLIPNTILDKNENIKMLGTKGIANANSANPFTNFGSMSPGGLPVPITVDGVAVTTNVEATCEAGGYLWVFFANNKIRAFNLNNGVEQTGATFPYTMSATMGEFTNCLVYNGYIYFRYNLGGADAGKSNIGRFDPALAGTVNETFMSGTVASGAKMDTTSTQFTIGEDEKMYIMDGANVHRYDPSQGANGTLYQDKFQLVGGTITAFSKVPNYLVLYVNQTGADASNGECFAYWWNYEDPRATYIYPIPGYNVLAGFSNFQGTHGAVVQAKASFTNGANNVSVISYQGGQYGYGHLLNLPYQPYFSGVDNTQDFLYINVRGVVYQYGQYYPGVKNSLQRTYGNYHVDGANGVVRLLSTAKIAVYTRNNALTNEGLHLISSNYNSQSTYATPQFVPPVPFDYRCKLESVYINWGRTTSGGHGININILTNKANTSITVLSNQTVVTEAGLYQKILTDTSGKQLGAYKFDSIGFDVSYTAGVSNGAAPIIQSLEVHYTYEKI